MNKGLVAFVAAVLLVANFVLLYQNVMLKRRSAAIMDTLHKEDLSATQADSLAKMAALTGGCVPTGEASAVAATEPAIERRLAVHLYFSLTADCMSCIVAEVSKWNELAAKAEETGAPLRVRGFTQIDGARAQRTIDRDLKPIFPISHLDDLTATLAVAGVPVTPVVLLIDEETRRTLAAHYPEAYDKEDRSFLTRVQQFLDACG